MGRIHAVSRRFVALLGAVTGAAVAVAGCGASQVVDPVAQAAQVTASAPGYRMSAVMSITGAVPVTASMSGAIDTAADSGTMRMREVLAGHQVNAPMVFSRLNFWMRASAIAGAAKLTGGRPWIYVDMSKALGAMGVGSLPGTTDPSQFLNYLHAVGANPSVVGKVTIHGVHTTEYRAVIDLDRYKQLYHASATSISTIESALGSHTMPVQAWIDGENRVRRIHIAFPECVAGKKDQFSVTMGLYDFGPQPQVQVPQERQVYNLTPLLTADYGQAKLACTSVS